MSPMWRHLALIAACFIGILLLGTVGYIVIEGWSVLDALFMTVITVTTVGYSETRELSEIGRLFTIFLILIGWSTLAFVFTRFLQIIIGGDFIRYFREKKMSQKILNLKGHYIVCGYGRMGKTICRELADRGIKIVVSEASPDIAERARHDGHLAVVGSSLYDSSLVETGILNAGGLITAVSADSDNLLVTLSARELNHNLQIIARAEGPENEAKLLRAGADVVISPYLLSGKQIARLIFSVKGEGAAETDDLVGSKIGGHHLHVYEPQQGRAVSVTEAVESTGAFGAVSVEKADGSRISMPGGDIVIDINDKAILYFWEKPIADVAEEDKEAKKRIVIADDHVALLNISTKKLRALGYEVYAASSGTEADALIRKEKPDLAILDLKMPGKTGDVLCREIRDEEEFAGMKIIIYSAHDPGNLAGLAAEVGADAAVVKTGRSGELVENIEKLIGPRR